VRSGHLEEGGQTGVTAQSARQAAPSEERHRSQRAPRQRHRHAQHLLAAGAEHPGQGGQEPQRRERPTGHGHHGGSLTASLRLRRKIDLVIGPFASACEALVEHPRLPELWPEYLILQHQIIRATVPLTEAALERARALAGQEALAEYLLEHVDEELNHDETLLGDLERIGIDRASVLERLPSPDVAALVGQQYYWILHSHPIAFLGYVAVMEGYPPTPELIETLIERTRFPREAFTTFVEHSELDPGHRDHLDRTLDALPLDPQDEAALGVSAIATATMAARSLEAIVDQDR
jgi:hypothetical protein